MRLSLLKRHYNFKLDNYNVATTAVGSTARTVIKLMVFAFIFLKKFHHTDIYTRVSSRVLNFSL